jgi:hypothetical protein
VFIYNSITYGNTSLYEAEVSTLLKLELDPLEIETFSSRIPWLDWYGDRTYGDWADTETVTNVDWYEEWTGTKNGLVRRMDWYEEWTGSKNGLVRRLDWYEEWTGMKNAVQ